MKKIVHISIYNRSEYTCMHTRNYVQTNRFANNRIEITWNGEGKFSLLCYARYARKLVASHLFRSCRKYRARNFPSPLYRRMRDRFGGVHVYRGRVHLFTNAQPRIPISKGYILDRQPSVLAQDNRDKWPVIRRSLKRGHSYELPEPAVSKIDFQLRRFGIPLRLLRRPLQSLDQSTDSTRTEIRRRTLARR